ncbi:hypothetical protein P8452_37466 [Trifolium repens]|nr:hypothetical protein P8452_37466 [Trifolium repens]
MTFLFLLDDQLLITTTTPPLRAYHKFYHYVSLNVENIFQGRTFIYGSVEAVDKREIKFNKEGDMWNMAREQGP